jgi:ectoine hydroxylase-related dioxygenase (phytanoyl-CoA dioxygenase family)
MTVDYSEFHYPVSNLFAKAKSVADWERYRLSEQQIDFFHRNGYLSGIPILNETQIQALRSELNDFLQLDHSGRDLWHEYHSNESADASKVLFHALGAWRLRPGFHDLLWHPAAVVPASQLLSGDVRFWHDQLFCKPAYHGGVVAWHQDFSYWTRTTPMAHLTCWIGLDDSTKDNGCLEYIPGSHRWSLLPITGLVGDMRAIESVLTDEQLSAFRQPVAVEMPAGYATFHHPLIVHGSKENRTDRPRRATVLNVFRDGVESATNEPLLAGVQPIAVGSAIKGQFFPLIFGQNHGH